MGMRGTWQRGGCTALQLHGLLQTFAKVLKLKWLMHLWHPYDPQAMVS